MFFVLLMLLLLYLVCFVAGWTIYNHSSRCGGTKKEPCGKYVWARIVDCGPCGPNSLGVTCHLRTIHCKACGVIKTEYTA